MVVFQPFFCAADPFFFGVAPIGVAERLPKSQVQALGGKVANLAINRVRFRISTCLICQRSARMSRRTTPIFGGSFWFARSLRPDLNCLLAHDVPRTVVDQLLPANDRVGAGTQLRPS